VFTRWYSPRGCAPGFDGIWWTVSGLEEGRDVDCYARASGSASYLVDGADEYAQFGYAGE
jgi:hypothetical protein